MLVVGCCCWRRPGTPLTALHAGPIVRWALAAHASAACGLLFPMATRALPLLLLFVTFLFINTEVWQVASNLTSACCG